jgi:hypothetical protein
MTDEPTLDRSRRVSITKLQRHAAAGAELISLCQTITDDGRLADEEVTALRQWVDDHASADLPARDFLLETVRRIIEDGKVTDEERTELYQAIEKVLPPDIRADVRGKRRAIEEAAEAVERDQREAQGQLERDAKRRNRPVGSWNFMVAGCRYEGRPAAIRDYAVPGERAYLVRDRGNRFSRNAVEVRLQNGAQAGYVPEEIAIELAPLLDQGLPHTGVLTKILAGGRTPIPVVQARIFNADAQVADLVLEREVPTAARVPPPSSAVQPRAAMPAPTSVPAATRTGCLPIVVLFLGATGLAASIIILAIKL